MRALVLKELMERWPLVPFGGALAALALVGAVLLRTQAGWSADDAFLLPYVLLVVGPLAVGLLAGSPLFAGESARGTLPLLLMLPLSRAEVWAGKLLAGALLALGGSFALALPLALLAPEPWVSKLPAFLVLVPLGTLVALFFGALCSALSERPLNALLAGMLLLPVLAFGVGLLVEHWLHGVHGLDAGFWTIAAIILAAVLLPLLFASFVAVCGGDWFRRAHRWAAATAALAAGGLLMVPLAACVLDAFRIP